MKRWFIIGLGATLGLSHIGLIGMVVRRNEVPKFNLPVGNYTTYKITAGRDGYELEYRANDPKVMVVDKDIVKPGGFLGFGKTIVKTTEQYTMNGALHQGTTNVQDAQNIACIEAIGSAKGTGQLVGASVGASAAPALSGIPFVGWVAAGWATMFGAKQGENIAATMASDLNENCQEDN